MLNFNVENKNNQYNMDLKFARENKKNRKNKNIYSVYFTSNDHIIMSVATETEKHEKK